MKKTCCFSLKNNLFDGKIRQRLRQIIYFKSFSKFGNEAMKPCLILSSFCRRTFFQMF